MNIQHACQCYAPARQPAQQAPAEMPGTQPASLPAAVKQATTTVASFSYSYSAYFSQVYVSAASQSTAQAGAGEAGSGQTTETAASQPKTFDLSALQFGVSFMASYAAVRQESAFSGGQMTADPQAGKASPAEVTASEAPRPAKVLTGTVRAALQPAASESADTAPATPTSSGTSPAPTTPASGEPGQADKPAIERAEPAEFRKFRLKQFQASTETALKLELETREGDRIVLDFSQVEALSRTRLRGRDDDGGRVRYQETARSLERLVNIEISGDISEEERAAIDAVFDRVLEVANGFFGGSTEAALNKVRDMEIDTETLLDFSLKMSQKRSIEATRAYADADAGLERLASRDVEVSRTLEYLGETQRGLVEEAREVLDDRSAAKMVRSLLPAMLEK